MTIRPYPDSAISSRKRGFTLTEIAIVLGIIGLILGAIWVAASSVYNNMRVSRASQELLQVAQQVRAMYSTQTTMDAGVTTTTFIQAGVFPGDMLDNGTASTQANNPWRAATTIAPATSSGGVAGDSFSIAFAGVPQSACITMLTSSTGTGRDQSMIGAGVGTVAVSNNFAAVNASSAATACASTTSNTVYFAFRLRS